MDEILDQQRDDQIIRYLREQLSAQEKAQFEVRMLEEPELLERVQLLEALTLELRSEAASALLADTADTSTRVLPFRAWIRQPLSLAASLLAAVAVVHSLYRGPAEAPQIFSAPVGTVVLLEGNRSDLPTEVSGSGPYLMQIDAGLDAQAASFSVVIRNAGNQQVIVEETGLGADANGWLRLLVQGLPAGEYAVAVTAADAQGAPQTRSYRLLVGN